MERKRIFFSEAAYVLGLVTLALGTAFMERADFGMSMVVAPAYVLYRKLSELLPFVTFGMAEYGFQAVLLLGLCLALRRWKLKYLFSFVTAVLYGFTLDGCMALASLLPAASFGVRAVYYLLGLVVCALGVSLLFHTDLPPEAYELTVKEVSARFGWNIHRVKTVYDCVSCLLAVVLSFAFFGFGRFEGVKWGTVLCALVNGWLIGRMTRLLERRFTFEPFFHRERKT